MKTFKITYPTNNEQSTQTVHYFTRTPERFFLDGVETEEEELYSYCQELLRKDGCVLTEDIDVQEVLAYMQSQIDTFSMYIDDYVMYKEAESKNNDIKRHIEVLNRILNN